MHRLDGAKRKLARAAEHIQEFNAAVQRWYDSKPLHSNGQFGTDKTSYIYTVEADAIPLDIGILAGDALHNLRSVLDHIAWQLALLTTSTPYKRTAFPIFLSDNDTSRRGIKSVLRDVPTEARNVIEALQPFSYADKIKPDSHGLWLLHQLSNADKHQIVTIGGAALEIAYKAGMSEHWLNGYMVEITVPLTDGSIPPPPQIAYYLVLGRGVIGNGARVEALGAMEKLLREGVLPKFEHFFTE